MTSRETFLLLAHTYFSAVVFSHAKVLVVMSSECYKQFNIIYYKTEFCHNPTELRFSIFLNINLKCVN